eukprot:m.125253 g.125253  ORF g.125253 m.125253 type:complete len:108 (-) comp19772_c4_seq1:56-379(-)
MMLFVPFFLLSPPPPPPLFFFFFFSSTSRPPRPVQNSTMSDVCGRCNGKIFAAEKPVQTPGNKFHEACFKCCECGTKLTLKTYNSDKGEVYCASHQPQKRSANPVTL